jgi:hypothetical protein
VVASDCGILAAHFQNMRLEAAITGTLGSVPPRMKQQPSVVARNCGILAAHF